MECRAVIKFLVGEGASSKEIHSRLVSVYGNESPSLSAVKKIAAELKSGPNPVQRRPRLKLQVEPEAIELVNRMVLENDRIKIRDIAKTTGMCAERIGYILHEELHLSKVGPKWVPAHRHDSDSEDQND